MIKLNKLTVIHGVVLTKVHRVITFNQKVWIKPNINMNTDLRKAAKKFWKIFFQADE